MELGPGLQNLSDTEPMGARSDLGVGAWLDVVPRWVADPGHLYDTVMATAPWVEREVDVFGRAMVDPRLTTGVWPDPPEALLSIAAALSRRYDVSLTVVSACLYRTGRDHMAWHADRIGRFLTETVVASVSLGSARPFLMRSVADRQAIRLEPGPGDLVVMGGTAQRTWEHCVPRVAATEPRLSVLFRQEY